MTLLNQLYHALQLTPTTRVLACKLGPTFLRDHSHRIAGLEEPAAGWTPYDAYVPITVLSEELGWYVVVRRDRDGHWRPWYAVDQNSRHLNNDPQYFGAWAAVDAVALPEWVLPYEPEF